MKWQAFIVLLAIALSIVASPAFPFLSDHGAKVEIGTLDVCHSATPALFSNGEMPCVNVGVSLPLPLALNSITEIVNPPLHPFHIAFQDELPPKQ
jgi:hypothetical protein